MSDCPYCRVVLVDCVDKLPFSLYCEKCNKYFNSMLETKEQAEMKVDVPAGYFDERLEEIKRENQQKIIDEQNKEIRLQVITLFQLGKRSEATELLVKEFCKNNKVYTIRDDENAEGWIYKNGIYIPEAKTYITEYCRQILGETFTGHICNVVIAKIQADTFIDQDTFFRNQNINEIAVENGVLHLFDKTLTPFTPDKIFFNKLPVKFDPTMDCPAIKKHFETILKKPEDAKVMWEFIGFCLYKDYKIEKAIMLLGNGRNGKGKTCELIKRFLGEQNCSNIPLQQLSKDNFAKSELFGKLVNLSTENAGGDLENSTDFKELTGHDLISAARKNKTRIHFQNYAKWLSSCNELPRPKDISTAFFARWVLLEFPYTFLSQQEIDILPENQKKYAKIANTNQINELSNPEELSGMLNEGLNALKTLLAKGDFSSSSTTNQIKQIWLQKSDSVQAFIQECCEDNSDEYIEKQTFKCRYAKYCQERNLVPFNAIKIKKILENELGYYEMRKYIPDPNSLNENATVQARVITGLKLKDLTEKHEPINHQDSGINTENKTSQQDREATFLLSPRKKKFLSESENVACLTCSSEKVGLQKNKNQQDSGINTENEKNKFFLVKQIIENLEQSFGKIVPFEEIIKVAIMAGDFKEGEIEEIIQKLKTAGEIFEPLNGFISKI